MIKRDELRIGSLPEMLNRTVTKFGERHCQWFKTAPGSTETASLTYSEVGMIVRDISAGLQSLGIKRLDRVAIMAYNCPQWLWSYFAILGSGAVSVPLVCSGFTKLKCMTTCIIGKCNCKNMWHYTNTYPAY